MRPKVKYNYELAFKRWPCAPAREPFLRHVFPLHISERTHNQVPPKNLIEKKINPHRVCRRHQRRLPHSMRYLSLLCCAYQLWTTRIWSFGPLIPMMGWWHHWESAVRSVRCSRWRYVVCHRCTTERQNTHVTDQLEVLYPWYPWFGKSVYIHSVIDKPEASVFRCNLSGRRSDRLLEVPIWMFDRAACAC